MSIKIDLCHEQDGQTTITPDAMANIYGESVDEKSPNQNNKKKYGNATYLHGMIYFNRLVHLDGSRRAFSAARENCN